MSAGTKARASKLSHNVPQRISVPPNQLHVTLRYGFWRMPTYKKTRDALIIAKQIDLLVAVAIDNILTPRFLRSRRAGEGDGAWLLSRRGRQAVHFRAIPWMKMACISSSSLPSTPAPHLTCPSQEWPVTTSSHAGPACEMSSQRPTIPPPCGQRLHCVLFLFHRSSFY